MGYSNQKEALSILSNHCKTFTIETLQDVGKLPKSSR